MHPRLANKQKQVLNTVKDPDAIFQGQSKELLATTELPKGRHLVVVYKELAGDGFIITAYDTTDVYWLFKKKLLWSKPL